MDSNTESVPGDSVPRKVRVLAPRMSPIITDGTVSIILTDDYRLNPYAVNERLNSKNHEPATTKPTTVPLQYALGADLDAAKMWLEKSLPNSFRAMNPDWVLFFDCNPDLMLAQSMKDQNAYLATRVCLGLPGLRWAADLRFLAERQMHGFGDVEGVT